ncbi:hypothetical protein HJG60_008432 [Phyllostomus discolor]|uniref:Uncharacterized protein n=1 Tax=Phyllostomus discolor TaxID=89673 RepID=A0A833Z518_9CHIR|nr:hypothetical protein HJG60_008432 [Phyllostomus discolor]
MFTFISVLMIYGVFSVSLAKGFVDFFKVLFIYFRERGREKRERNISVWLPITCPLLGSWPGLLTRNQTGDPLVCRPALNPLSHTSQGLIFSENQIYFHLLVFPLFHLSLIFIHSFLLPALGLVCFKKFFLVLQNVKLGY